MSSIARFYEFNGKIAITVGDGSTTYLTTDQAEMLATKLLESTNQVKNGNHSETVEVPADDEQIKRIRDEAPAIYKIVRCYRSGNKSSRTIKSGLTVYEAQEHCSDPKTSTKTYFDTYEMK